MSETSTSTALASDASKESQQTTGENNSTNESNASPSDNAAPEVDLPSRDSTLDQPSTVPTIAPNPSQPLPQSAETQTEKCTPSSPMLVDNFTFGATGSAIVQAVRVDSHGHVYALGRGFVPYGNPHDANGVDHTIIRKSSDHGRTWATIYDDTTYIIRDLHDDGTGVLFAAAELPTHASFVIRSNDGGSTWDIVKTWDSSYRSVRLMIDANGIIYAAGGVKTDYIDGFFVAKSSDHGLSWVISLPGFITSFGGTTTTDVSAAIDGSIYLRVWNYGIGSTLAKSIDQGATWTTLLSDNSMAQHWISGSIFVDRQGRILESVESPTMWKLLRSANGGNDWEVLDSQSSPMLAGHLRVDSGNSIFIMGDGASPSPGFGNIVRKIPDGGTPITIDQTDNAWNEFGFDIGGDGYGYIGNSLVTADPANPILLSWRWIVKRFCQQ